eukprot:2309741-Karenia_brevis.AAC.1
MLGQSFHDGRYCQANRRDPPAPHNRAWNEEEKRRRAALDAAMKQRDRARERIVLERQWHEMFDEEGTFQEGDLVPTDLNPDEGVDTEYVSGGKGKPIRVETGRLVP